MAMAVVMVMVMAVLIAAMAMPVVATATVADHLGHVRQRLAELQLLEQELSVLHQRCKGDGSARCALISALHRHAEEDSWLQLEKDAAAKRPV